MKTQYDWFLDCNAEIGPQIEKDLTKLIDSDEFHWYIQNSKSDNGENTYNGYGDYKNNLIYATVKNNGNTYYGRVKSNLISPAMIDRRFRIDVGDSDQFQRLTDVLCYVHCENHTFQEWIEVSNKFTEIK